MSGHLTLILGGSRSGKSAYAETLARAQKRPVVYVATCRTRNLDADLRARIERHQHERPEHWHTIENRFDLASIFEEHAGSLVLVDCLTLWLGQMLETIRDEAALLQELEQAWQSLRDNNTHVLLVSNELSMGPLPDYAAARAFQEACGRANQCAAQAADEVFLVIAGLPCQLKGANINTPSLQVY